ISINTAFKHNFLNDFVIKFNDNDDDHIMKNDEEKFDFESEKWTLDQLQNSIHEQIAHFQVQPEMMMIKN
ncbi:unnamed protein product, partial [Rotaria sordida]